MSDSPLKSVPLILTDEANLSAAKALLTFTPATCEAFHSHFEFRAL